MKTSFKTVAFKMRTLFLIFSTEEQAERYR